MQAEQQARQLINEAEKKMSPKGFFQLLFSNKNRTDEAIGCYQRAGHLYRLAKNWRQAGSAFNAAADLSLEQNSRIQAANNYVMASKCMEKFNIGASINSLLNAIKIYVDLGRYFIVAKLHNTIAEIYEQNLELENAVEHYEQAAEYFKVDENVASAKYCILKMAYYTSVEFKNYHRAIELYQEAAFYDLRCPMLQYGAKDYLFRAVLCHLCLNVPSAKHAMDFYAKQCPAFNVTREYQLLERLIQAIEQRDEEKFRNSVLEYEDISRLDTWLTKMLLTVKQHFECM